MNSEIESLIITARDALRCLRREDDAARKRTLRRGVARCRARLLDLGWEHAEITKEFER